MKTIGILGGLGPESTVDYYRFLIAEHRRRAANNSSPPILINSLDVDKAVALVSANNLSALADYLGEGLESLARAGADFGLLAANTPHIIFDQLQRRSPIPLLSIVQATCNSAQRLGMKKLALLGTGFTMRGRFYPDVFARAALELIVPNPDEIAYIHDKYLNELLKNLFLPETRARMMQIVERLAALGAEGMILAGTELPLLLRDTPAPVPFLDTTLIHVNAAVDEMLKTT